MGCVCFNPRAVSKIYTYIGDAITAVEESMIEAEISRLVNNYILVQQDNIASEAATGFSERPPSRSS